MLAAAGLACSCSVFDKDPLAPRGEALILVDTDLPVPLVVSRLRVDVTTEDGRWIATRDDVRPDPRDWPTSFSVYAEDDRPRTLLVRLRAYPDARVVAYRGGAQLEGGETPAVEPDPTLAVDRTLRVPLAFGTRGRMRVTLRGACVGKADCGDPDPVLEATMDRAVPSAAGTFAREACDGADVPEDRACIPGGAFVLGDAFYRPTSASDEVLLASRPERVVALSRFALDRTEVTVGRFRAALARGFTPPTPVAATEVDGPPGADPDKACTWSAAPRGREAYPLSCVTWDTARAFCRAAGGDLPTEAQLEYAGLAAGRSAKATYPWGEHAPSCEDAVYGRATLGSECLALSEGLPPAGSGAADVTPGGVRDLAGSLTEHVRDDHASYDAPCWTKAETRDPVCELPPSPECVPDIDSQACRFGPGIVKSTRGASWLDAAVELRLVARGRGQRLAKTALSFVGFRCAYPLP